MDRVEHPSIHDGDAQATATRYWCAQCRAGYPGPGCCPHHPEEPLLDLGDEEVWLMLDEQDQRAKWSRMATIGGGAAAITVVMTVVLMFAIDAATGWTPHPVRLAALIAVGTFLGGGALFMPSPSMPALTEGQREALLALGRADERAPRARS